MYALVYGILFAFFSESRIHCNNSKTTLFVEVFYLTADWDIPHKNYLNIPLTLQAYLYGDIEKKGSKNTGAKQQRMNSFSSSRVSKESKDKRERQANIG